MLETSEVSMLETSEVFLLETSEVSRRAGPARGDKSPRYFLNVPTGQSVAWRPFGAGFMQWRYRGK